MISENIMYFLPRNADIDQASVLGVIRWLHKVFYRSFGFFTLIGGKCFQSPLNMLLPFHLSTGSLFGWTRWESGGGAELPQQQAEDCDSLFWQLDKV